WQDLMHARPVTVTDTARPVAAAETRPITTPGLYVLADGRMVIDVREAGANGLTVTVGDTTWAGLMSGRHFTAVSGLRVGEGWFVFADGEGCVGVYDGRGGLWKVTWDPAGSDTGPNRAFPATDAFGLPAAHPSGPSVTKVKLPVRFL